jgi:hypothetical protein
MPKEAAPVQATIISNTSGDPTTTTTLVAQSDAPPAAGGAAATAAATIFVHTNPMVAASPAITIAAPPGGSVIVAPPAAGGVTFVTVDDGKGPAAEKTSFHGSRLCTCSHYYTTIRDTGVIAMDKIECCFCCGQAREAADVAKVSFWSASSRVGCCCTGRSGSITARLDSTDSFITNKFSPPVSAEGLKESYRVNEAMRLAQRKEIGPRPFWMNPEVRDFTRPIGCCGLEHWLCRCWPLCTSRTHKVSVGPQDEITLSDDATTVCGRTTTVTGTSAGKVELATASRPVGCCGVTGSDPNWGRCECGCTEGVDFVLDGDRNGAVAMSVKRGSSTEIINEVFGRVEHPALGPERVLQSYTDTHPCFGSKGKLVITNSKVSFEGYKHPTHCCKAILPFLPNICCWPFQVYKTSTAPLDRIYAVAVEGENPCSVMCDACTLLKRDCARIIFTPGLVAPLLWILVAMYRLFVCLLSPILTCICWPFRQTAVKFKTRGGDVAFSLRTPHDTDGKHMRDFAEHIVVSVREAQKLRASILSTAHAVIGASKM